MIVQCEECGTKFNLPGSLIKDGGSKVRCSVCKHIFVVYSPEETSGSEAETVAIDSGELEETVALDSAAAPEPEEEAEERDTGVDFGEGSDEYRESVAVDKTPLQEEIQGFLKDEEGETEKAAAEMAGEEETPSEEVESEEEEGPLGLVDAEAMVAPKKKTARFPLLLAILIAVFLCLGGAIAVFFWAPGLLPDFLSSLKPPEQRELGDPGVRRLSFKAVNGSFVDSPSAGRLFVIRGVVGNDYPRARRFILVKGAILNDKGEVVKEQMAFAGNDLSDKEIKSLSIDAIRMAMKNRYGKDRKNLNVAPGATIPFTIVFDNLPDNLGEFTVEAVSSSPGA